MLNNLTNRVNGLKLANQINLKLGEILCQNQKT